MRIDEFQKLIEDIYFSKDSQRGLMGTFAWFIEEVGELSRELRSCGSKKDLQDEFADVLAWLSTLASIVDIDLAEAAQKYSKGCPKCSNIPCVCDENRKGGHHAR